MTVKALVTGAAGFIGSHLVEHLLKRGIRVTGIDALLPNYGSDLKRQNLQGPLACKSFRLVTADLMTEDLGELLADVQVVFHLAGQPGVRQSWGRHFTGYVRNNIESTQRLLEAAVDRPLQKFVLASTSSVYGNVPVPMREDGPLRPVSPYGVTKLAAEHLGYLYARRFGVPVVSLRYFTVYGPRQRPDMAFHRFIVQALAGRTITLHRNGTVRRDFTYVADAVEATVLAAQRGAGGETYNVGGGTQVSLLEVVEVLEAILGRPLAVKLDESLPAGDIDATCADTAKSRNHLGFFPRTDLAAGLQNQVSWLSGRSAGGGARWGD